LAGLFGRQGRAGLALAGLIALAAGGFVAAGQPAAIWLPVGLLALVWLGCRLLLSPRSASAGLWRHPRLYGGLALAAVPVLGGLWLDFRPPSRDEQLLAQASNPVSIQAYRDLFLYTDRGRRVR